MNKNLRILKWIYTEGLKENPMPYKELAEHCGVCSAQLLLCNRMKVWLSE